MKKLLSILLALTMLLCAMPIQGLAAADTNDTVIAAETAELMITRGGGKVTAAYRMAPYDNGEVISWEIWEDIGDGYYYTNSDGASYYIPND